MESFDDRSYLQVHLWRSTFRKMTYPLFLCAGRDASSGFLEVLAGTPEECFSACVRKTREQRRPYGQSCRLLWRLWPCCTRTGGALIVGCLSWGTAINGWITQRIMWIQMIGTFILIELKVFGINLKSGFLKQATTTWRSTCTFSCGWRSKS